MIDVIIPIYKGFDETRKCLESVLQSKNNADFRVIAINDYSPDQDINHYLNLFHDDRVVKLSNQSNLGFVKTVNKGMNYSNNDVIILNSDTIVTDRWIDKLFRAAYSSNKVGTVTPLTNNGTIASVPYFNQDNSLPQGYSIESFSELIERVSMKAYPIIPTAVGHAMFIKRQVMQEIGILDEITFGKGYYEEVDFSFRVSRAGYTNILADDTYIFHFGSTSFKQEKIKLIKENKKKLFKKHMYFPLTFKYFLFFNREVKLICKKIQQELNY